MSSAFWEDGYKLVEGLLDKSKLALVSAAMDNSHASGRMENRSDAALRNAQDEYSPAIGDMLMEHCRPVIEEAVKQELIGSYAYWRIYGEGGIMARHKDRAASEVAVSITIGAEPGTPEWPLSLQDLNGVERTVLIREGEGLVYHGHTVEHWRDPLARGSHKQLFLFYVLKGGDFAQHARDRIEVPVSRWRDADG